MQQFHKRGEGGTLRCQSFSHNLEDDDRVTEINPEIQAGRNVGKGFK